MNRPKQPFPAEPGSIPLFVYPPNLEIRVRQLERQQRLLLAALIGLLSLGLMGQTSQSKKLSIEGGVTEISAEQLTVKKIRLVDDQGRPRANLMTNGPDVYLMMGESSGRSRLALKVSDGKEASLTLADEQALARLVLQCNADGSVKRVP